MTITLQKEFCVYSDWTLENPPRPFYVGKGKEKRAQLVERNAHHARIRRKHGMTRKIELETDDESEAFAFEEELIERYDTFASGANQTRGGRGGCVGFNQSNEVKNNLSEIMTSRWEDPTEREKLITANRNRWNMELREAHSKMLSSKWDDAEFRHKTIKGMHAYWSDPENHAKRAEQTRKLWKDPEYRKKLSRPRTCKRCGQSGHYQKTCTS